MIRIIAVSDGHSHFENPIREYEKRLDRNVRLTLVKSEKWTDPKLIVKKETDKILEILKKEGGYAILLDERGAGKKTLEFASEMRSLLDRSEDIVFIIGWAFWVDRERLDGSVRHLLRLSDFVMPHSLALLTLLEQLYRIHEIWKGTKYHHA